MILREKINKKGERKMDRIQRKKPEFRRIAAMIMAVAMIISVIPFPEGLFHVTAAAAVKMSATWTAAN